MSQRLAAVSALAAALAALAIPAGRACAQSDKKITALLATASQAPTPAAAEAKFKEAEGELARAKSSMDPIQQAFTAAEIKQSRGQYAAAQWRKASAGPDATPPEDLRISAEKPLLAAQDEFQKIAQKCEDEMSAIEEKIGDREPSTDSRWRQASAYMSRAKYAEAWLSYNLGLVAGFPGEREKHLNKAVEQFKAFTEDGYLNHGTKSGAATVANPVVADCFLGQALAHFELKLYAAVTDEDLKEPTAANTPENVFKRMALLRVRACQAQGLYKNAEDAAQQYLDKLPPGHKHDLIDLGLMIERARNLMTLLENMPEFKVEYQARLDKVGQALAAQGEPWRSEFNKIAGVKAPAVPTTATLLGSARNQYNEKHYAQAIVEADKALALANKDTDAAMLADLRTVKAAACWTLKRYRDAHLAAYEFLQKHPTDPRVDQLRQIALQAGIKAVAAEPPLDVQAFFGFLGFAEAKFPADGEIAKAPWYLANAMIAARDFAGADKILRAVKPASPAYRQAQYGLSLLVYKQAEAAIEAKSPAKTIAELLDKSADACRECVKLAFSGDIVKSDSEMIDSLTEIAVATTARMLEQSPPQLASAAGLLDWIDQARRVFGDRAVGYRMALRARLCILSGKMDDGVELFDKLLVLAKGGSAESHVAQALVELTTALEGEYERLSEAENKAEQANRVAGKLVEAYEFLLGYVSGSKDKKLKAQELTVRRRLAAAMFRVGRHNDAILQCKAILTRLPKEQAGDVLRILALAYEKSNQHRLAVEPWTTLSYGLPRESDGWYEANYHVIWCQYKSGNKEHSQKLLALFRLSQRQIKLDPWEDRFAALGGELGVEIGVQSGGRATSRPEAN